MAPLPELSEQHLLVFLIQVLLLLALARGFGEVSRALGHPRLVGEILVGILLGPTLLGRVAPALHLALFPDDPLQHAMLETVSWVGVLFLLLETGLEVDASAAWRLRGPSLRIGIIGVIVPLTLGFVLSLALPARYFPVQDQRVAFALFLGTTMAISAIVIVTRVLRDLDLIKTDLGLVTLCGYAVNDILAWVIFSLVLAAATQSGIDALSIGGLLIATVAFTGFCLTLGVRAADRAISLLGVRLQQPSAVLTFVACLGLLCGAITSGLGLTALLGFFLAGIMAGEARALSERVRNTLTQMVHAIFVPLYFAAIALRVDFFANFDLFLVSFVTLVSIGAKFLGAWLGSFGTGLSREDQVSIGIAFTPSGVTGIVVGSAALEVGILTVPAFVAIVFSAIVSSLVVGPLLTWSIRRRREVNILDFFARRAVSADLQGQTRFEALRELSERLAVGRPDLDSETVFAEVRAREELMGTGLGNGIAIAHARLPTLARPVLTFGRSVAGLDWDAPDGLPVHHVFLLITPVRDHGLQLQILAALAHGMAEAEPRERLVHATGADEIWAALEEALREQNLARVRAA